VVTAKGSLCTRTAAATASSAEQLEQMVSKMASSQDRHVDPPPPRFVDAEQELVILEDDAAQHGRQASGIPACNCNSYVNGAVPFSYACSKQQGATKFCYPAVGLTCNSDMTLCIDPYPSASPGPG